VVLDIYINFACTGISHTPLNMKLSNGLSIATVIASAFCITTSRQPLSYASVPNGTYVAMKPAGVTTLLDFVKSREELSVLAGLLSQLGGE
jgi:hypothetical protein